MPRADFVRVFEQLLLAYRAESARQALESYNAVRLSATGSTFPPNRNVLDKVPPKALDSIGIMGYKRLNDLSRKMSQAGMTLSPTRVNREVAPGLNAAAEKAVLDAGRDTTTDLIVQDDTAIGFARLARPKACGWCKMLSSRGFVYSKDTVVTTTSRAKRGEGQLYHDGCRCVPIPQFTEDQELPESVQALETLWGDSTEGLSGKEALSYFRAVTGETKGTKWKDRMGRA